MTEDEMVGWHHRLNGHEFEQALGDGKGQGSLACCSPWGPKESNMASRGFSRAGEPVWDFSRGMTGSSGSLSCGAREVKSHASGEGERVIALESW